MTSEKRSACKPSVYYRKSIWPDSADQLTCINKHAADRVTMWVYLFISILAVNRRMSYAEAMNMDNVDASITFKNPRISSDITFDVSKWKFQNAVSWPNLSMLCNLTLLCRLLWITIKVSGIKCLFKILLVIRYASIPRYRPTTSGRNIWLVASNLTSVFHCIVVFHLMFLEFGWWTVETLNLKTNLCRPTILMW